MRNHGHQPAGQRTVDRPRVNWATARSVAVVIGRNEGERLARCLDSLAALDLPVVYVDSGSSDGSPALAESKGAVAVTLDPRKPFTAARGRNEGAQRAVALAPQLSYLQFIDGDCILNPDWPGLAERALDGSSDVAAVCGRRREADPSASVYNWVCDREWATPAGEAKSFGGDVLIRADAFAEAGGFRDDLICGEEPELGVRLRAKGWRILRLDAEMTLHDANMHSFRQWWRRAIRSGYGTLRVVHLHSASGEPLWKKDVLRSLLYGLVIPAFALAGAIAAPVLLFVLLIYPLHFARILARESSWTARTIAYAALMTVGKFAETWGILRYVSDVITGRYSKIIEYK